MTQPVWYLLLSKKSAKDLMEYQLLMMIITLLTLLMMTTLPQKKARNPKKRAEVDPLKRLLMPGASKGNLLIIFNNPNLFLLLFFLSSRDAIDNDEAPRLAQRPRRQTNKYIPETAKHKASSATDGNNVVSATTSKKPRGRKKKATKEKVVQPQLRLHVSPPSRPLSDFDFQYQSIPKPAAAQLQHPVVSSTNSSHHQQPTTAAGINQQFDLQLVTKLHESDKEIAVLKAQVDFYTQSADRTTKIQNDMKALCFEILDKGADLTKKGATVATENNTALSTTISTVVAATGSRKEDVYSGTFPTTSNNHMMFPVFAAAPPTIVNLSTQQSLLSTEESSRASISSTPLATVQQQHHPPVQHATPPFNGVGISINPQSLVQPPQTPQQPTVPQFYPTIQGKICRLPKN